jgi:hypothetical protein
MEGRRGEVGQKVRDTSKRGPRLTRVLQRLDVLGSGRQFRHHLHELGPGFLVLLEHCGERARGERRRGAAVRPAASPSGRPARSAYLAAPASDSWRPQPEPLGGQSTEAAGVTRPPTGAVPLCTRVSQATDRNRNAAVSRQRPGKAGRDVTAAAGNAVCSARQAAVLRRGVLPQPGGSQASSPRVAVLDKPSWTRAVPWLRPNPARPGVPRVPRTAGTQNSETSDQRASTA